MGFFEAIATALDQEGIESRVHGPTMFVPITAEIEIQFVEIDPVLPAANVYIAAADVDQEDEAFEAALVAVVFSAEDAVRAVSEHIATDQVVTVLRDLLDGEDERLEALEFFADEHNPQLVYAEVGALAEIHVHVEVKDTVPVSSVKFLVPHDEDDAFNDVEELDLGDFHDTERLFDVLALAAEQAEEWEAQLLPLED